MEMHVIDAPGSERIDLSVVVSAAGSDGLDGLVEAYLGELSEQDRPFELICVFDGADAATTEKLEALKARWPQLALSPKRPWAGEDVGLKIGIERARAPLLLTLPGWREVAAGEIKRLLDGMRPEDDMVVGDLSAAQGARLRAGATHGLVRRFFGRRFSDLFCRVRLGKTSMFRDIQSFGVRQHFLPLLAVEEGFAVREERLKPGETEPPFKLNVGGHMSALSDLLALFVTLRFLRRPLRFFGAIGLPLILIGGAMIAYLLVSRLIFGEPLADRPLLVLAVTTLVLGIQVLALGLVGEIVIFSSTRRMRTYEIETIIRGRPSE